MTLDPADLRRMAESAAEAYLREPSITAWDRFKVGILRLERVDAIAALRLVERVRAARDEC
jgi:hypothetical protein